MAAPPIWKLCKLGILSVIFTYIQNIHSRVLPELPNSKESTESTIATGNFLDQISTSKLECLLEFVENPDEKLDCIDKHFGDDRSQFLLSELHNELLANTLPDQDTLPDDVRDQTDDQLVADLNTLSKKSQPVSNDEVPIINTDKIKRVDEQVNTPKKEQQRNALGESVPEVTAQVVKSTDAGDVVVENTDQIDDGDEEYEDENQINDGDEEYEDENQIDDGDEEYEDENQIDDGDEEYDYDSSLVAKLYNMLQDMIEKETFDYGLKMNEDDDDSDEEEEQENLEENKTQELYPTDDSNSGEEEEGGEDQYANEIDELGDELMNVQGGDGSNSGEDSDEEEQKDIAEIEENLVNELNKMLEIAKQAGTDKDKRDAANQIISSDKFREDLRHMEKALKESTS